MSAADEVAVQAHAPPSPVTGAYPGWWRSVRTTFQRISVRLRQATSAGWPNASMVRMITALAILGAVTIAAVLPVSWFVAVEARVRGEAEIQAQHYTREVTEEARQNPVLWNGLGGDATEPGLDSLGSRVRLSRPT
jgi:hypothetical protein